MSHDKFMSIVLSDILFAQQQQQQMTAILQLSCSQFAKGLFYQICAFSYLEHRLVASEYVIILTSLGAKPMDKNSVEFLS